MIRRFKIDYVSERLAALKKTRYAAGKNEQEAVLNSFDGNWKIESAGKYEPETDSCVIVVRHRVGTKLTLRVSQVSHA